MGIKFRHGKVTIVNYGPPLTQEEIDTLKQNYAVSDVDIINFRCKGWSESTKPWYLQCVDWIKLIPEPVIKDGNFVLKLPDRMPKEIGIYMAAECFSRSGMLPKIYESRDGKFFRIVDLAFEVSFSKEKRKDQEPRN